MLENEKKILVSSWIEYQKKYRYDKEDDSLFWAYEKLDNLCRKNPDLALEIIFLILKSDQSDIVLENLAAGPLEDLLVKFGPEVISPIESYAKENPVFKKLLGGIWRNNIAEEVWNRVLLARDESW